MAYGLTAKQFFEGQLEHRFRLAERLKAVGGVVLFEISGRHGGTWLIDLGRAAAVTGVKPDCIFRANDLDFMALLEGRMSASDGLITERLELSGDAGRVTRLLEALASFYSG